MANAKTIFNREKSEKVYILSGVIVIIFFLVYNFILAFSSLEGTPKSLTGNFFFPYLTEKPLTEDGYYMLTVAWNIAAGKGFSYNYNIQTTGVQPLAAVVFSVPAYVIQNFNGSKYTFARFIIIFSAFLQVVFAYLIYRLALSISKDGDKGLYFLVSMFVVLLNFKVLLNFANGLETGLYLILLSFFFLSWFKNKMTQPGVKHIMGLGILSGLLILCRLDAFIILIIFYVLLLVMGRLRVSQLALILFIAFLLYLPWQLYVLDVTGNVFQSSARSQTAFLAFFDMPYKVEQYFTSIIQHLTPFLFTGNLLLWLMFPLGIFYIVLVYLGYKRYRQYFISESSEKLLRLIAIPFSALVLIYFFFSSAPHFYFRYTAFIMVLSFPVLISFFAYIIKKYRRLNRYIFAVLAIMFGIQSLLYLHSGKSARAFTVRLEFVNKNFTKDFRIAAFQTGVLGYYCENIFNLDGKIDNSALESYSNKGIDHYIDSMNINVLMEWKDFIPVLFKEKYLERSWRVYKNDIGDGRTICYVRKENIRM